MTEALVFTYERPALEGRAKRVVRLARATNSHCNVQVVGEGGETNLHSHTFLDGYWIVLSGRARFYTTDDEVVGDLGPMEGVLIPREYPYWFEAVGGEELEILQIEVETRDPADTRPQRVDYTELKASSVQAMKDYDSAG